MSLRFVAGLVAAALAMALLVTAAVYRTVPHIKSAGSVIKLRVGDGHGSATHIGNGYLVSAAHVMPANTATKIEAVMDDGAVQEAEVLWVNKASDIALLFIKDVRSISASTLVCRTPAVGEELSAKGNPVNLEFITTRGRVAGTARTVGPWRVALPMDMSIAAGMSGGGVFDDSGRLVGVVTGMMLMPIGFGGTAVGLGYIVPGSVVCGLLARGA